MLTLLPATAQLTPAEGTQAPSPVTSDLDLNDPAAVEQRADLFMVRKFFPEAIQFYQRLTKMQPQNAIYFNKMGIAYHQMQRLNDAKKAYQTAAKLDPGYARAINNIAAVEYSQKNYRGAIFTYLKALSISPSDPVIYSNIGTAYFAYDEYEYAVSSYRYALLLDPQIFERTGRVGEVVHQREVEDRGAFFFYMAKTYASLGHLKATLLQLQKAYEEGYPKMREAVTDPAFASLADDPLFLEFVAMLDRELSGKSSTP
jgi:tetratricopeptide (TPR) repeat protein